jgi:ATP-dependent DNA helicase RecG
MTRAELAELIRNGENSGVEFKRDDIRPEKLAEAMAAFLNLQGGHILLGVEDDGTVTGLARDPSEAEKWVMEVARSHLRPAAIPFWETMLPTWSKSKTVFLSACGRSRGVPDRQQIEGDVACQRHPLRRDCELR